MRGGYCTSGRKPLQGVHIASFCTYSDENILLIFEHSHRIGKFLTWKPVDVEPGRNSHPHFLPYVFVCMRVCLPVWIGTLRPSTPRQIMSDDYGQTGECNYYIAKEVIWSAAMAFAFPKGSHITAHFNKWYSVADLTLLWNSGIKDSYMCKNRTFLNG